MPRSLKKALMLRGETEIGVAQKKYLSLSNGDSNAIPRPPFVKASRIPCVAVIAEKYKV